MDDRFKKCITGKSGSGHCGAAACCPELYRCCAECLEDCNIRCGWTDDPRPRKREEE